jgi:putative membrane protein
MNIKNFIVLFVKGMFIGIANAIPGVSGGTLAFVLGVYEKLTFAISELPKSILRPREFLEHMKILVPIGLGAGISIVLFLSVITYLFSNFEVPTKIFFVGLILGSIPIISKSIIKFNFKAFVAFFFGALIMTGFAYFDINSTVVNVEGKSVADIANVELKKSDNNTSIIFPETNVNTATANTSAPASELKEVSNVDDITLLYGLKLFLCGLLAAISMVIPGISGSLLLLILGEYENIAYFVSTINIPPLICLGAGVIIGIFAISKLITYLLSKFRDILFSFVLGIIIVSLLSLWPNIVDTVGVLDLFLTVLSLCIGFCLSIIMERFERE